MPITLRGTQGGGIDSGDLTITLPAGTAQNDLVLAGYTIEDTTNTDWGMAVNTPGYTEVADLFANGTRDCNLGAYYKLQGPTPDSNIVFDNPSTEEAAGGVVVLTGANTGTPLDATTTTATGINTGGPDPPAITTVTVNAWTVIMGGSSDDGTPTAPASYGNLVIGQNPGDSLRFMAATRTIAAPGAENPGAFGGLSATDTWCAVTFAIRPAPSGGFIFKSNPYQSLLVR